MTTVSLPSHHITRAQLRGYGLSDYLVRRVTATVQPVAKRGNAHCFELSVIMVVLRDHCQQPRTRSVTRTAIQRVLTELSPLLGNIVTAQFNIASENHDLRESWVNLIKAQKVTDQALAEIKAMTAEIRGRSR